MFHYSIRKSGRARRIRITICADQTVCLTIPSRASERAGLRFLEEKRKWVESTLEKMRSRMALLPSGSDAEYRVHKEKARSFVRARLEHFNASYGFSWNNIAIRNTSSRWGSCSQKRNLNFSYRIFFLPPELADYVIVHELCHLKEFNHSPAFWKLVERTIPNSTSYRKRLRGL